MIFNSLKGSKKDEHSIIPKTKKRTTKVDEKIGFDSHKNKHTQANKKHRKVKEKGTKFGKERSKKKQKGAIQTKRKTKQKKNIRKKTKEKGNKKIGKYNKTPSNKNRDKTSVKSSDCGHLWAEYGYLASVPAANIIKQVIQIHFVTFHKR